MSQDPALRDHAEWIGFLQPTGLVVSPPALVAAGALLDRNVAPLQKRFERHVVENDDGTATVPDLPAFLFDVLGWDEENLVGYGDTEVPDELREVLAEYQDVLEPTYAVPDDDGGYLLLVKTVPDGDDLDRVPRAQDAAAGDPRLEGWRDSHQARFNRLLRSKEIPIGILSNGTHLRLVYAPRGESTGFVTFPVEGMREVAGRPILSAFHLLLNDERLFLLDEDESLPHILKESRKYQNEVSAELGEQVILALWELLRGFQAADEKRNGRLLAFNRHDPEHLYGGVLSTILRLVFVLYAEDNELMPSDPLYQENYSVGQLFRRLRDDAGRFTDHMEQRFGAWSQLLTLFRLVHDGAAHGDMRLPARRGQLFDPDAYPFLEGREYQKNRVKGQRIDPPRVSDGVVYRVLKNLLVLKGERLSYRSLDVEQIGSVYEGMMGFTAEVAMGPSIAVGKDHIVVDLGELLEKTGAARVKALQDAAGVTLSGKAAAAFKEADDVGALVAALERRISKRTPQIVPAGGLYLQPTEERRRTGSHYTPRSLTEPIVRTTLRPVLEQLGKHPTPQQILDLKVCDPAMGSGAFLVEACRQLADHLVEAWRFHKEIPELPPDEELDLHARRLVAQRCLYGVDKNEFAVNLAKMSLWLITLAKDHPFTFVDHALRLGDSLVGLWREQILSFDWEAGDQITLIRDIVEEKLAKAEEKRKKIHELGDVSDNAEKRKLLRETEEHLENVKLIADLVVAAFFGSEHRQERRALRSHHESQMIAWTKGEIEKVELKESREILTGIVRPFHWPVEFPEIFANNGFHFLIGNPPFAGKNTFAAAAAKGVPAWLRLIHEGSHGNSDLVAHFFRRAYSLLRERGTCGLIATNTIGQGDTRSTGLQWICTREHGYIYEATRRVKWPGAAAVIVSIVHIAKNHDAHPKFLNNVEVERITPFLFHTGPNSDPYRLAVNFGKSFQGSIPLGAGMIFDDSSSNDLCNSITEMERLIERDPRNAERIFPYIGGREVNTDPDHAHHRYVINFELMTESEARQWPDLIEIVERKVRPARQAQARKVRQKYWWRFGEAAPALYRSIKGLSRVLVTSQTSKHLAFTFLVGRYVFDQRLVVFPFEDYASFAELSSRVHGVWAGFFGSSMKDDPVYTPSDCFETFPISPDWRRDKRLEEAGGLYYDYRKRLMLVRAEGMTTTYNRFHNPEETDPDIQKLRTLHDEIDRAVLDAYGWTDIRPKCEFLLDYEVEDDEPGKRRKKKPWRYRWPDDVRDEVLGRLLELNAKYAEEERRQGEEADVKVQREREKAEQRAKKAKKAKAPEEGQGRLPGVG